MSGADDSGALRIVRSRRRVARAISHGEVSSSGGFGAYEAAQGPGLMSEPVEGFKFEQGANVWRLTSADRSITFLDGTFDPVAISRGELDFSQEDTAQTLAIQLPADHPVALLFIAYNPATPVTITAWRRHRPDEDEVVIFPAGQIISWNFEGAVATLTCAPVSNSFRRRVPALVFQSHCNWALYGPGCGLDKNTFKSSGFVTAYSGTAVRAAAFALKPDGWFVNGWAELANLERRYIIGHVGDTLTLQVPFSALAIGQAIDAFAGCQRTEDVCEQKFNNLVHHLGFPRIPTRNPYAGSVV